jgi:hypothetical protein
LDHHLPILWPWLFERSAITESRRLHATAFQAGESFLRRREAAERLPLLAELVQPFEEIRPDQFPRALSQHPDALVRYDAAELEAQRPFRVEQHFARWESLLSGGAEDLVIHWEATVLSPLSLYRAPDRMALALAARAEEFGLDRRERATALIWLLFGQPVSREAKALHHAWVERAAEHPGVSWRKPAGWWRRLTR